MERQPFKEGKKQQREQVQQGERKRLQRFQFGPWLFNVDRAKVIVAERPRDTRPLPVPPWAHFYGLDTPDGKSFSLFRPSSDFSAEYALTTDLSEPLIVATLRSREHEEFPLLVDGTHRVYRAFAEGRSELPAYVLSTEESLSIREDAYYR